MGNIILRCFQKEFQFHSKINPISFPYINVINVKISFDNHNNIGRMLGLQFFRETRSFIHCIRLPKVPVQGNN